MKNKSDVVEYAWLMEETGYQFAKIFQYNRAQDAYFCTLDDEEKVDEEAMKEFIENHTTLTKKQVQEVSEAQLKMMKTDVSYDEETRLVTKMMKSMTTKDRELVGPEFLSEAYDYIQ